MEQSETTFLKQYDPNAYERPSVTVDMLIFTLGKLPNIEEKGLYILLIKRKHHPFQDCWAIPGGFVNMDESLKEAAYRELEEETGVRDVHLEQLYAFGDVKRDPRMRVISIAYLALSMDVHLRAVAADDAKEAAWFHIQKHDNTISLIRKDGHEEMQYVIKDDRLHLQGTTSFAFDHEQIFFMGLKRVQQLLTKS